MPDVITCTSEGDDPSGRRRPGVNRPDDAPARPAQGCELGAMARENPPAGRDREPVCEPHDSTGEPGAGNRHAGFGERGEETYPRESACGPAAKAPGCATDPYRLRASPRLYKVPRSRDRHDRSCVLHCRAWRWGQAAVERGKRRCGCPRRICRRVLGTRFTSG